MPPSYWNLWLLPSRSSSSVMTMPPFRNASSRSRWARVSKLNTVVSKISVSGLKVTLVPRRLVVPVASRSADRVAALVVLLIDLAVAPDFEIERFRQGVDHRDADAVQTARHLVAVVVELPAGVQNGHHDFGGRLAALVKVDRNPAAVVHDGDRAIDVNRDVDLIAESRQRLVDRVVDHLVDEMMQAGRTGRADVHRRPLADRLQPLEDLDLVGGIVGDVGRAAMTVAAGHGVRRYHVVGERLFGDGFVFCRVEMFHVSQRSFRGRPGGLHCIQPIDRLSCVHTLIGMIT